MCGSDTRIALPLAPSAAGCSCCGPRSSSASPSTATSTAVTTSASAGGSVLEFGVEGLTCGHCVQTVERAVSALEGVDSASVDLVPGGRSRLAVRGKTDDAAVRGAVSSAGYALTSS